MSQWTQITIRGGDEMTEESLAEIVEAVPLEVSDLGIYPSGPGVWIVEGNSKWQPDGLGDFCERVSLPRGRVVEAVEEWNTLDADEPGQQRTVYVAGDRCAEQDQTSELVPADLKASITSLREALETGSGVKEAALWLVDGLEGTRAVQSEPRPTLVSVEVVDEASVAYSDLFASVFDFDTVVDVDGGQLQVETFGFDRRLTTREDVSPILRRWIESLKTHTGVVYTYDWNDALGAYLLPYWDGKTTGYLTVGDDGEGRGSIPFESLVSGLGMTATAVWSDGTTTEGVA